jgi:hypothetical protein
MKESNIFGKRESKERDKEEITLDLVFHSNTTTR